MSHQEHVIVKRVKSHDHDGHHGGAWKVAFADFMIALMALFLVLWILQVADEQERKAIVATLNSASVFDNSFGTPFDSLGSITPIDIAADSSVPSQSPSTQLVSAFYQGDGSGTETDSLILGRFETQEQLAALAKIVEDMAKQINAQGNVDVTVTPQGLRIVLQDDYKQHMFHRGGAKLTPFFEDLLLELAPVFGQIENPLIISGHTDATQYKQTFGSKSNWELSVNRANQARQTLVAGSMPESRVLQVSGMSDRALLNHADPKSSENRRIELFVLTTPAADIISSLFGQNEHSELEKAKETATFNQPVYRQNIRHDAPVAEISTPPAVIMTDTAPVERAM